MNRCPNCGKFLLDELDSFFDREHDGEFAAVVPFCDESCADAYRLKRTGDSGKPASSTCAGYRSTPVCPVCTDKSPKWIREARASMQRRSDWLLSLQRYDPERFLEEIAPFCSQHWLNSA